MGRAATPLRTRCRRFFQAPVLVLIAAARHVAEDEATPLKQWMEQGKFGAVSDDMARTFLEDKQEMWAVVERRGYWYSLAKTDKAV